ncbi:hypothetical protein ACOBWA_10745 [Psychrobacter sp. ER1]|uniref:hypothetical protein n=1 Tax=Psychrobacter sp. ER1 TaxID=3406645 RepID=UPI003B4348EA|tara:strand:+ start:1977 stop:2393 length:417 start_codon:yes stop_codon:yes gene_type:complete
MSLNKGTSLGLKQEKQLRSIDDKYGEEVTGNFLQEGLENQGAIFSKQSCDDYIPITKFLQNHDMQFDKALQERENDTFKLVSKTMKETEIHTRQVSHKGEDFTLELAISSPTSVYETTCNGEKFTTTVTRKTGFSWDG